MKRQTELETKNEEASCNRMRASQLQAAIREERRCEALVRRKDQAAMHRWVLTADIVHISLIVPIFAASKIRLSPLVVLARFGKIFARKLLVHLHSTISLCHPVNASMIYYW